MNVGLFIWQLPQNIVGSIVFLILKKQNRIVEIEKGPHGLLIIKSEMMGGVCLGDFIFINQNATEKTRKHEFGHQKQSLILGPLYLLPFLGISYIVHQILHTFIPSYRKHYYKHLMESWADKLGKVER